MHAHKHAHTTLALVQVFGVELSRGLTHRLKCMTLLIAFMMSQIVEVGGVNQGANLLASIFPSDVSFYLIFWLVHIHVVHQIIYSGTYISGFAVEVGDSVMCARVALAVCAVAVGYR